MGWIAGPAIPLGFGAVTWYMSLLLADAYRHPRDTGPRNRTYPEAVQAILGDYCVAIARTDVNCSSGCDVYSWSGA